MFAFITFLSSPLGKLAGTIGAIGLIFVGVWAWLTIHDNAIRREALEKFNKAQMELVIKGQQEFIAQTKRLEELSKSTLEKLDEQQKILDKKLSDVEAYLNSPEVEKQNRSASPILKETIRRLGNQKK